MLREAGLKKDEKIYSDEPIIRTAAKLQDDLPEIYRKMRSFAKTPEAMLRSDAWVFCRQGEIVADATDDYVYNGNFERYFPTYQLMSDKQLRGYVSWRTKYRSGDVVQTSLSFVFVYIYELLNLIGVKDANEAFDRLIALQNAYCGSYPQLKMYLKTWLCDFAAYYGLEREKFYSVCGGKVDEAMIVLKNYAEHTEDEFFAALCSLSAYKINDGRFCRDYPEDVKAVCCRVYSKYSEYCAKNRKKTLFESLFGVKAANPFYRMFSSAVFHDSRRYDDYVYEVNEIRKYTCRNGIWSRECYPIATERNKELGKLLKAVDAIMRQKYGYKNQLKYTDYTKLLCGIIEKETDAYLEEKKKNARPKIEINLSMLSGIRAASEITKEKLIVEDEFEEAAEEAVEEAVEEAPETETENEAGLDETEYRFLHCLLYGGDYKVLIRERKVMLSVLVDAVNEKLYDIFADTVIDFDGDTPALIEDYTEDLKGIVK